ncbi:hypothetical protein JRQ81_008821 [Phrynocephalus forsythii]|uniref:R3H domain-containing protein n=1 Tax=Phrynocephalus forsythii TaxID=171643 RepID=A0A9Q0XBP9_9SAUR|nr:hypothetical protein JRQ81_008821 [Phrynocephalus forsythii]
MVALKGGRAGRGAARGEEGGEDDGGRGVQEPLPPLEPLPPPLEPLPPCRTMEGRLPPSANAPVPTAKRFSPAKRKQYYIDQAVRNSDLIPRAKGRKSLQRLENTRYLMTLLEQEGYAGDEGDPGHPAAPSIFSEACNNKTYMRIWNDFMNRSGEEQERLILYLEEGETRKQSCKWGRHKASEEEDGDEEEGTWGGLGEGLGLGFQIFCRIGTQNPPGGCRCLSHDCNPTVETLGGLEEELLSFFSADPHAVYTALMDDSFKRLLLHAVCQYMDLKSASSSCQGQRQMRVINHRAVFLPPQLLLSAYLEQMSC